MLTENNIEEIYRVVLVANTPAYLYRTLRRKQFVVEIGSNRTAQELVDELVKVQGGLAAHDSKAAAIAYGLLVALSYKPRREILPMLESLELNELHWGPELKTIVLSEAFSLTEALVSVRPRIVLPGSDRQNRDSGAYTVWFPKLNEERRR